jgi:phosphatidylglycerophosphate synthase
VALALTIVVAASLVIALDGVDGWLARRSGLRSAFGARFDMETDALLIMALAVLAWTWEKAGAWVLFCGLMRYAFVAAGVVLPWIERPLPESFRRKAICVIQIAGLAAIALPVVHPPISTTIAGVTLMLLTYSFAVDVVWLRRRRSSPEAGSRN